MSSSTTNNNTNSSSRSPQEVLERLKTLQIIPHPLPERELKIWKQKIADVSSLSPHLRERIASAMCFAIDHCTYAFHLIEILVAAIDPLERAKEIRNVIWKLSPSAAAENHNLLTAEIRKIHSEVRSCCNLLLARLFLLSDIFMNSVIALHDEAGARTARREREEVMANNTTSSTHTSSRPSDLARVIELFLDITLAQQLAEFVVLTKRRDIQEVMAAARQRQKQVENSSNNSTSQNQQQQQQQQQQYVTLNLMSGNISNNEHQLEEQEEEEDPISQVVGWIREMWAFWKLSQSFSSPKLVKKIEDRFGFLLITPKTGGKKQK